MSEPGHGYQHAPPRGAAHRIEAHSQSLREHDKRDHGESGERSNQQRQKKKYLLLALLKMRDRTQPKNWPAISSAGDSQWWQQLP